MDGSTCARESSSHVLRSERKDFGFFLYFSGLPDCPMLFSGEIDGLELLGELEEIIRIMELHMDLGPDGSALIGCNGFVTLIRTHRIMSNVSSSSCP